VAVHVGDCAEGHTWSSAGHRDPRSSRLRLLPPAVPPRRTWTWSIQEEGRTEGHVGGALPDLPTCLHPDDLTSQSRTCHGLPASQARPWVLSTHSFSSGRIKLHLLSCVSWARAQHTPPSPAEKAGDREHCHCRRHVALFSLRVMSSGSFHLLALPPSLNTVAESPHGCKTATTAPAITPSPKSRLIT
jgi:hypothetical protein